MATTSDLLIFAIVVAARLFVPLAIPKYPIPAGIAALVIDAVDQTVFQTFTKLDLAGYQGYDKALDIYYLSVEYLSTMRNWVNLDAFAMSRFLYYYRLIGSLLFELTHVRAVLLFFPNTFEYFFLFYEAVRLRWNPRRMSQALVIGAAFFIWVFIKIPQEYWIHIAQLDVTDILKEQVFHVPTDTSWGTIVAQNLSFFLGLVVLVLGLIAALRWYIVNELPPADWSLSFDADAHGRDVTPAEASIAARQSAQRLFDAELFEKIALVSLVTIIFSQVLPSATASVTQTAVGVAVVILVNTVISEALVRRGVDWRSTLLEFVVMAVVNVLTVIAFSLILPLGNGSLDVPTTLFILLLITLLVTLYDRFRPYYQVRRLRAETAARERDAAARA
jgi:hypothetical protein